MVTRRIDVETLEGRYDARVELNNEILNVPIVITSKEQSLYDACSPKNPWFSSLTFTKGVPLAVDYHGAEATLAAYTKLGTLVAFIPKSPDLRPPFYGRMFIHPTDFDDLYIPQPAYCESTTLTVLLQDAVDSILYELGYDTDWSALPRFWDKVYVDREVYKPITKYDDEVICDRWGVTPFTVKTK
jgi:hypothetical protein